MRSRLLLLALLCVPAACSRSALPPPTELTATSDPVTRLVRNQPAAVLRAGVASLRELGFEIDDTMPGSNRVFSRPMIVQSTWRGDRISDRIVCGMGMAAPSDATRTTQLANTIPIELRLGYSVEPRAEATATTLLFIAEGRRSDTVVPTSPTMSCTLTVPFVNELFRDLERMLDQLERNL